MSRFSVLALVVICLPACSGSDQEDTVKPVEDSVFSDQVQTMDRARGVEDQLNNSADARRQALEDQER